MQDGITFIGSGKLGFPEDAIFAFALGCDMVNVAREAMLAIGCIQAQKCHTNHCPTGVATQDKWLMRGLDTEDKSARVANYILTLRKEILRLSHACGLPHPALVSSTHLEILNDHYSAQTLEQVFGYEADWSLPSSADRAAVTALERDEPLERRDDALLNANRGNHVAPYLQAVICTLEQQHLTVGRSPNLLE